MTHHLALGQRAAERRSEYFWQTGNDQQIRAENDRVGRGTGVATIALLMPLSPSDPTVGNRTLHAVEGAYIAQIRANELSGEGAPERRHVVAGRTQRR